MSAKNKPKSKPQPAAERSKEKKLEFNVTTLIIVALVAVAAWVAWSNMKPRSENTVIAAQRPASAIQRISPKQYQADYAQAGTEHILVDVRTPEEFASGHIAGAVNISLQSLPQRMSELPQDRPIVLYCRSGNRSNTAAQMLARAGYTDIYDLGGVIDWRAQGLPLQ